VTSTAHLAMTEASASAAPASARLPAAPRPTARSAKASALALLSLRRAIRGAGSIGLPCPGQGLDHPGYALLPEYGAGQPLEGRERSGRIAADRPLHRYLGDRALPREITRRLASVLEGDTE